MLDEYTISGSYGPYGVSCNDTWYSYKDPAMKTNQLSRMSQGLKVSTWQRWNEGIANYWITHIQARERHVHFTHHSEDFFNRTEKPGVQMGVSLNGCTLKTPQNDHF